MVTGTRRMTMDEFLALPEEKPYREFVRGEVFEKTMPGRPHGRAVARTIRQFGNFPGIDDVAELTTEVRHAERGEEDRVYLPDVSLTLRTRLPADEGQRGPLEVHPDIAIEVLSPDDRASIVFDKVQFYLRPGVPIVWVIDPAAKTLTDYRPGMAMQTYRPPDKTSADPILPGFALDLEALFAAG